MNVRPIGPPPDHQAPERRPARRERRPFLSGPETSWGLAEPIEPPTGGSELASGAVSRIPSRADERPLLQVPDGRGLERLIRTTLHKTLSANPVSGRAADLRAIPMAIGRLIPTP